MSSPQASNPETTPAAAALAVVEALYAFAEARGKAVLCFAHVTNQMGQAGDFEKGVANGAIASLGLIEAVAGAWLRSLC